MSGERLPRAEYTRADLATERAAGYAQGLAAGRAEGLAARPDESYYAPVAVPWRRVRAQDVIRGDDGELYSVVRSGWVAGPDNRRTHWGLTLACGDYRAPVTGDPDDRASVLIGLDLLAAVTLTGEQLGARLIATRADPDGGHTGDVAWRAGS